MGLSVVTAPGGAITASRRTIGEVLAGEATSDPSFRRGLLNGTYGASGSSCKDGSVAEVARLMTFVDADDEVPDARRISVSARHEAVLDDGRRLLLMDDRGWSESGPPNIWVETSV